MRRMKRGRAALRGFSLAMGLVAAFLAAGCDERKPKDPQDEKAGTMKKAVDTAVKSVQRALELRDQADMQALHVEIQQYYAEHGRYPESLRDLPSVRERGLETDRWIYDPATGTIRMDPVGR